MCITGNQRAQVKSKVLLNHKQRQIKIGGVTEPQGLRKSFQEI